MGGARGLGELEPRAQSRGPPQIRVVDHRPRRTRGGRGEGAADAARRGGGGGEGAAEQGLHFG
uniref:Uncharacterized protein n=1 Tax=Arundo donax TaxID=35708 RepID=A0A0A8YBS6_ARUDO